MATNDKKDTTVHFKELPGELTNQGRNVWLAGLGALATVGEEGTKLYNTLVQRGSQVEEEGAEQIETTKHEMNKRQEEAVDSVRTRGVEAGSAISKALADALERFGVPTRQEVTRLSDKVDALAGKVDTLTDALENEKADTTSTDEATVYLVISHEDGGWAVQAEGAEHAASVHETKKEAREAGRELAKSHKPSRLVIRKKDGAAQETFTYGLV